MGFGLNSLLLWIDKTMLVERLAGVGSYALLVVLAYMFLRQAQSFRSVNRILNVVLIILCVLAFFFIPDKSKDLYRWFEIGKMWEGIPLIDFVKNQLNGASEPLGYLLVYLCTKTKIYGILPMVCAFIFYINFFHILKRLYQKKSISNEILAVAFLFFMSAGSFLEVISGVRCFVAFSIVARCIFDELVDGKNFFFRAPFFIIACMIHSASIPLVAIRIAYIVFFEVKQGKLQYCIRILSIALLVLFTVLFGKIMLEGMAVKAEAYLTEDKYSYFWEYLIGFIQIAIMANYLYNIRKKVINIDLKTKNVFTFICVLLVVNFIFIFEYNIFHRFLIITTMLFVSSFSSFYYMEPKEFQALKQRIVYTSALLLMLACVRGNLCGYKFFEIL